MNHQQIADDTIDAMVALGHRRAEAKRLVSDALGRGAQPSSVQELLHAVYQRPSSIPPAKSTHAVKGRFAGAYYEYLGGIAGSRSASEAGHSDLLQIARAVGPGLSVDEFEALGKRVDALDAQRDRMSNATYQEALWAIPEAFAAERKNPVHFRPLRDSWGKPVEEELPAIPPKAVEGLASAETPASLPTDALASLTKPAAPQAVSAQDMGAIVRGAGSGTVDAMYDGLWQKVQAGETSEGGQKSALLQAAKMVREGGGMQSIDDLRNLAKDYGAIERGDDFQHQMRKLVEKHLSHMQSTPAANSHDAIATLMRSNGGDGFKPGDGVTSTGKAGNPIAGIVQGMTDAGKFRLDTHEGILVRGREQLESYKPVFNPGDAVHMPRYAADSGGMGTVRAKNPDGTFAVNINGRELRSVRPADMQAPEGLEKTPREQAPAFSFAGAEESSNVSDMLGALMNRQPDEGKAAEGGSSIDKAQAIADAVGVVDQTGVTDLANAGVSLTRAFTEPERAGEHLANAGMRAISAIPIVGDVAKLAKYGTKGAEAARGGRVAHHLLRGGAQAEANAGGKSLLGGGIDTVAQAALQLVGGGSGGGDGGGDGSTTAPSGDAADPRKIGEDSKQAAKDISNLGDSIEKFLNGMGAAGATLATIGNEVYQRALKPVIDWFKAVDQTSKAMLEDNRSLAMFSGEIGGAFQKLELDRLMRDMARADDMGGSIAKLAGAQSRREQAQQNLTQPYEQLGVEFQAFRTELVGYIIRAVDTIDVIGNLLDWWFKREQDDSARTPAERAAQMFDEFLSDRKF